MKFFLDTANIEEIRQAAEYGLIDGVTTNPSLVSKEGRPFKDILLEITRIVDGPISAEVLSTDAAGILREAHELAKLHPNIVVKVPMIKEGMKALKQLSKEGIRTNVTLIFNCNQALIAAKVAKFLNSDEVTSRVSHRKVVIPGYVTVMSGSLEEESGWQVLVGPRESSSIPKYLKTMWKSD